MATSTTTSRLSRAKSAIVHGAKALDVQSNKDIQAPTRNRDTVIPVLLVSILFMKWGLAYGLLDVMNFHIRQVMDLTHQQSTIMATAYYLAYIPGTLLVGGPTVRKCGYRLAFVFGLVLIGLGALLVSGAASVMSFPGIATGMFLQGLGVSTLERSANPYATNCGPHGMRTFRILAGQSCAALGTIFAPLIANRFLLAEEDTSLLEGGRAAACVTVAATTTTTEVAEPAIQSLGSKLSSIVTLYRSIGIIVLAFAFVYAIILFRTRIVPELPLERSPKQNLKIWQFYKHPIVSKKYARTWAGIGANFINIGVQVSVAQFFMFHMVKNACTTQQQASNYFAIAQTMFFVGRLVAAALEYFPKIFKPRIVLWFSIMFAVIALTTNAFVYQTAAIVLTCAVMFFEAPSFPMIFESATAGLGEWTPLAEDIIILSITGGAVLPPLHGILVESIGVSKAWLLTAGVYCLVWMYCWGNNLIPGWRKVLDEVECDQKRENGDDEMESAGGVKRVVVPDKDGFEDVQLERVQTRGYFGGRSMTDLPFAMPVVPAPARCRTACSI